MGAQRNPAFRPASSQPEMCLCCSWRWVMFGKGAPLARRLDQCILLDPCIVTPFKSLVFNIKRWMHHRYHALFSIIQPATWTRMSFWIFLGSEEPRFKSSFLLVIFIPLETMMTVFIAKIKSRKKKKVIKVHPTDLLIVWSLIDKMRDFCLCGCVNGSADFC